MLRVTALLWGEAHTLLAALFFSDFFLCVSRDNEMLLPGLSSAMLDSIAAVSECITHFLHVRAMNLIFLATYIAVLCAGD
jgi:hypothetical protein